MRRVVWRNYHGAGNQLITWHLEVRKIFAKRRGIPASDFCLLASDFCLLTSDFFLLTPLRVATDCGTESGHFWNNRG
jgi:hypothetical protein